MGSLTLSQVADIAGVKPRTVQFWASNGALVPEGGTATTGTGNHRRFSEDEARIAFVLSALFQFGASIGTLCTVADAMRKIDTKSARKLAIVPAEGGFIVRTEGDAPQASAFVTVDMGGFRP